MSDVYTIRYEEPDTGDPYLDAGIKRTQEQMKPYVEYIINELTKLDKQDKST